MKTCVERDMCTIWRYKSGWVHNADVGSGYKIYCHSKLKQNVKNHSATKNYLLITAVEV